MMNFQYKIRDTQGRILSGFEEASNRQSLLRALKGRGFLPIAVIQVQDAGAQSRTGSAVRPTVPAGGGTRPSIFDITIGKAVKDEEILIFTRDLLSLVHSGVPLVSGLGDIATQIRNPRFRRVVEDVSRDINAGGKPSESFEKYPHIFSELYCQSVRAGEQAGRLEQVMERLAKTLEKDLETTLTIKNAVRYPLIVLCFLGAAFALMVTFVIPKISGMFAKFDTQLPLPTRFLIGLGDFLQHYGMVIVLIGIGAAIFISFYKKTKPGKFLWDGMKLGLPVFGALFKKVALVRFASTLQTLYASGVVVPDALEISAHVSNNEIVRAAILQAAGEVRQGKPVSEAMNQNRLFPPLVIRMMMMGEKTGDLDTMLGEVTQHYEREINYMTKSLTTLIEPLLTVILGVMILVFALGVFLPMWNLMRLFRH